MILLVSLWCCCLSSTQSYQLNSRKSGRFELTKGEKDDEDSIKKFFKFLEGHVLKKEANEDLKSSLQKHRRKSRRDRRSCDDEDNMSAQSLMGTSESKKLKCGFVEKGRTQQGAQQPEQDV